MLYKYASSLQLECCWTGLEEHCSERATTMNRVKPSFPKQSGNDENNDDVLSCDSIIPYWLQVWYTLTRVQGQEAKDLFMSRDSSDSPWRQKTSFYWAFCSLPATTSVLTLSMLFNNARTRKYSKYECEISTKICINSSRSSFWRTNVNEAHRVRVFDSYNTNKFLDKIKFLEFASW